MGESRRRRGDAAAHLHHAPQPRGVALARDDQQLAAARQEARQARERFADVILRDARLVEPDLGRPPLSSNEAAHPGAALWPGATSSSAHACDMNASTWPSSASPTAPRAGRGRVPVVLGRRRLAAVDDGLRCVRGAQVLGIQRADGDGAEQAVARQNGGGVCRRTGWRRRRRAAARCRRAFRARRDGERARRGGGRSAGWRTRRR